MKTKLPQTTTADADKGKRLKAILQRLAQERALLETIIRVKALIAYYRGVLRDLCGEIQCKLTRYPI